jgi:hypothetical protein
MPTLREIALSFVKNSPDKYYDDIGTGQYDYLGISERIPLHADKAEQFLAKGDLCNAMSHAKKAINLSARGYIGTPPYLRAERVLKAIKETGINRSGSWQSIDGKGWEPY